MATQAEQIIEQQLVGLLHKSGNDLEPFSALILLTFNIFENLSLKMITEFKKDISFALTVLATLKSERAAYQGESFAFIGSTKNNITPPMPLPVLPE
jgi:hypothetical protein